MKRVQLFEFEDQNWFPGKMRIALTKLIIVLHKMMGLGELMTDLIRSALKNSGKTRIVDMGSGSGGPMVDVFRSLKIENSELSLLLTDLYPNKESIKSIKNLNLEGLEYHADSVDATNLSNAPEGLKTMMNSFHHMNPDQATRILQTAATNKESILIYEMAENKLPLIMWWLFLPISLVIMVIMVLLMTPFVKPLTFYQVFFTYIIPVIPVFYAWDGQASLPRIYTIEDINSLLDNIDSKDYTWKVEPAKNKKGKNQGYYIFGTPGIQ